MAIIRIEKTDNYTVMSNTHLQDTQMSLKAKGLLSLMLSLPDEWDYSVNGLVAICKESEKTIKTTLQELKKFGYLVITKQKPNETETGRFEYIYTIYEEPQDTEKQEVESCPIEQEGKKQEVENGTVVQEGKKQQVEKQEVVFSPQLNTNILNTNKSNTKDKKKNIKKKKQATGYDDILSAVVDVSLREAYLEYIKMRKLIRAPMTDRALSMLIARVNELEPDNIERQKKLLDTAVIHNWKSVYPLRDSPLLKADDTFMTATENTEDLERSFMQAYS